MVSNDKKNKAMKQRTLLVLIMFFLGLLFFPFTQAINISESSENQSHVVIVYFYGKGCPHCAKMTPFLDGLQKEYPQLQVNKYEVYFNQSNRELFQKLALAYDTTIKGVPTLFLDHEVIVGESSAIQEQIKQLVLSCLSRQCENPLAKISSPVVAPVVANQTDDEQKDQSNLVVERDSSGIIVFGILFGLFIVLLILVFFASRNTHAQKKKGLKQSYKKHIRR